VTVPANGGEPEIARPRRPRAMTFRKRSTSALPTPDQSRRQSNVLESAWRRFGAPGPVIAFLNTRHKALAGHPLQIAIESDAGLERVQAWLEKRSLKA